MRVHIATYGCTLNRADSDIMAAILGAGHELVGREEDADVVVLNTCTVKGATENKIFERLRRLHAAGRKTVVAGCLTANPDKIRKASPSSPILSPSSLGHIAEAVEDAASGRPSEYFFREPKEGLPRAFTAPVLRVPIGEGCVSSCNFCQTRIARPFLRSYTPRAVVKTIQDGVRRGAREIQLTSMDCGAYGIDLRTSLSALLRAISSDDSASAPAGEYLVRLGMTNPDHAKRMLPDILNALEGPPFYRFLHVPVQSGSEKVCREMNRDHTVQDFRDMARALRERLPEATLSTDIIAGYPTETEDDFQQTLALLRETRPETVNLSKFSPRPGTPAKALPQLPNSEIKRRSEEASALIREITLERRKRFIGRECRVLITEKAKDFKGRDVNYNQVVVKGFRGRPGDFATVRIYDANHGSLFGEPARG